MTVEGTRQGKEERDEKVARRRDETRQGDVGDKSGRYKGEDKAMQWKGRACRRD